MKNVFGVLRSRGVALKTAVAASLLTAGVAAHAELPAWATSMGAEVSTASTDVFTLVGPIIGTVLVGFTIIKLVKRGANRI